MVIRLILISCFFGVVVPHLSAQTPSIENTSLRSPSVKVLVCAGLKNLLQIKGIQSNDSYELRSTFCKIDSTTQPGFFIFTVACKNYGLDTIRLFRNGDIILEEEFRIVAMPVPTVYLGDIRESVVSIDEIRANQSLVIREHLFMVNGEVSSFTLLLTDQEGKVLQRFEKVKGGALTVEQLDAISQLQPGNFVMFTDIFTVVDGIGRQTEGITIEIR